MAGAVGAHIRALFRLRGRATRQDYWIALGVSVTAILLVGAVSVAGVLLGWPVALSVAVGFGLAIPSVVALSLAVIRRFRDRNRHVAILLLIVAVPSELLRLARGLGEDSLVQLPLFAIALALWAWGFVELGFLRGTVGRNRYGEDPLGRSSAEVFS